MNNTENIIIRKYEKEDGVAFPQEECPVQNFSYSRLTQRRLWTRRQGTFEDICSYYHVL